MTAMTVPQGYQQDGIPLDNWWPVALKPFSQQLELPRLQKTGVIPLAENLHTQPDTLTPFVVPPLLRWWSERRKSWMPKMQLSIIMTRPVVMADEQVMPTDKQLQECRESIRKEMVRLSQQVKDAMKIDENGSGFQAFYAQDRFELGLGFLKSDGRIFAVRTRLGGLFLPMNYQPGVETEEPK